MTAIAPPAPPVTGHRSATPNLLRWLLRLHRPALLVWAGLLIAVGALLLWMGGPLTDASAEAWQQYNACKTQTCVYDAGAIGRYKDWYTYTTITVAAVPFLVAAWSGAALISRELENGTAQLAWTQSVSPARWLAAKLALPAALVTVGSGLLVGLHHWAWSTSQGRIDTAKNWYDIGTYAANGTATVAMALAGLVSGAFFGLLKRNSLASLVGSLCATSFLWSVVALATPHLWPTVTKLSSLKLTVPAGSGFSVSQGLLTSTSARIANPQCGPVTDERCRAVYEKLDAVSYYNDYHPQSHYWPLQLTATAIILAVTAALTVATFRLLKRQTGPAPVRKEAAV
nr:ABC transporter permease [Streptomyces sp. NBC_00886]